MTNSRPLAMTALRLTQEAAHASSTDGALERLDAFRCKCPQVVITLRRVDGQTWYKASEPGLWARHYDDAVVMLDDLERRYPE